jgi:uncharacterized protein
MTLAKNVLGGVLQTCCTSTMTGFYRDGMCSTGSEDLGTHVVCALITEEFLEFTKSRGNNLIQATLGFPGLKPGDRWCLCVSRWQEALAADVAPLVILNATHEATLKTVSLEVLNEYDF